MSSNIYDKEQKKLIPFAGNSEATAGSLDGLTDVNISSPTDGQVLTYDAENQVWKNGAGATVIESLGDIADVDLTDLEDGQTIIWDAVEQKWIPGESGSDYLAGFGIDIDENNRVKTTDFVGTQAEWDALTTTEKETYDFVHITDDSSDVNYSPGHAISDGTSEKTQREVLEFNGFDVTDDSVNGKTKIAEVPYTAGRGVAITNKEVAVDETIATTFTGTQAEWNALTATEKAKYNLVNITDDAASGVQVVVDEVTEGNMNAVTSNAVYDKAYAKTNVTSQITIESGVDATIRNIVAFTQNGCLYIYGRVQFTNALAYDSAFLDLGTLSVGNTIYIMTDGVYARANKIRVIDNVTSGTNLCFSCALPLN